MPRRLILCLALAALAGAVSIGSAAPASLIVGGTPIQIQGAPWAVFVAQRSGNSQYQCSGSIIDATHILTAAHCVYDSAGIAAQALSLTVRAGVSNFLSPSSTDAAQDRLVASYRVHPGFVYNATTSPDDVAVLTLSSALDLSGPTARAIALPGPKTPFPASVQATIAGFGQQSPTANPSGQLETETATIDPQGQCGQDAGEGFTDHNGILLCAVSPTSEVCHGDSGGGLVAGSTPVLIAVADSTSGNCDVGQVGIFAYVGAPELLQFIQGSDTPPTAPRRTSATFWRLSWIPPLVVGNTLTCATGGWAEPVQITYSFVDIASGAVLQTGPRGTYVLAAADVGKEIDCEGAVANTGGTMLVKTGRTTGAVKPAPQVQIQPPPLLTAKRGQRVTLRVVLRSPLGLSGKFGVCATLPASVGGHVCHSVSEPFGVHGAFPFDLTFTVRATAPLETAHIAISATAGVSSANATSLLRITKS